MLILNARVRNHRHFEGTLSLFQPRTFYAEFDTDHDGPHFYGVIRSHGMGKPGFITLSAGFHRTSEHRT